MRLWWARPCSDIRRRGSMKRKRRCSGPRRCRKASPSPPPVFSKFSATPGLRGHNLKKPARGSRCCAPGRARRTSARLRRCAMLRLRTLKAAALGWTNARCMRRWMASCSMSWSVKASFLQSGGAATTAADRSGWPNARARRSGLARSGARMRATAGECCGRNVSQRGNSSPSLLDQSRGQPAKSAGVRDSQRHNAFGCPLQEGRRGSCLDC